MGNSPSNLQLAVKGLRDADASKLQPHAWADLLGANDRPPNTPSDIRDALSDATVRELRTVRPRNLAEVISAAVERLEELLEPDEGAEHLGAAVAPHDAASLLSALRVLTRVGPGGCCSSSPRHRIPSDSRYLASTRV
jgi:hypothetical protein